MFEELYENRINDEFDDNEEEFNTILLDEKIQNEVSVVIRNNLISNVQLNDELLEQSQNDNCDDDDDRDLNYIPPTKKKIAISTKNKNDIDVDDDEYQDGDFEEDVANDDFLDKFSLVKTNNSPHDRGNCILCTFQLRHEIKIDDNMVPILYPIIPPSMIQRIEDALRDGFTNGSRYQGYTKAQYAWDEIRNNINKDAINDMKKDPKKRWLLLPPISAKQIKWHYELHNRLYTVDLITDIEDINKMKNAILKNGIVKQHKMKKNRDGKKKEIYDVKNINTWVGLTKLKNDLYNTLIGNNKKNLKINNNIYNK